jgi:RNA polymerase sigma-70 factor (ECF subfamily)
MLDVRRGSRAAFEVLFDRYRDPVWRFFRRRVDDSARAEELVQDVFVAILQNAVRYEPRAAFRSYLFGIAFNALKADRRKAESRKVEHLADEPPAALPDPDDTIWVRRALATLDSDHRDVLMLREYEQLGYHTEKRLNEILANRTGNVQSVLEVEREIARVRAEIESLDAQLVKLDDRVAYATVTLRVTEERRATLDSGPFPLSSRLRNALIDGLREASDSVIETALWTLRAGPVLLIGGAVIWFVARLVVRRVKLAKL